jgi:transcriptional regulator with XRE-family HTH domain
MPRKREGDNNNLLRSFRALRNKTQQEVADAVGVSRTLWSAWEGRTRPMSIAHLNKIKEVLELTGEQILELIEWWELSCFDESVAA